MTENNDAVPRSFRIIGGAALAWNLIGVVSFVMQLTMANEAIMALPEAQRVVYENIPTWATVAWAVAVGMGSLGCLLLLLRRRLAVPCLVVSLVGVMVQMYFAFVVIDSVAIFGTSSAIMPVVIIVVGIALIGYARSAQAKGWIN